jgi:hypothetical protein
MMHDALCLFQIYYRVVSSYGLVYSSQAQVLYVTYHPFTDPPHTHTFPTPVLLIFPPPSHLVKFKFAFRKGFSMHENNSFSVYDVLSSSIVIFILVSRKEYCTALCCTALHCTVPQMIHYGWMSLISDLVQCNLNVPELGHCTAAIQAD